MTWKLIFRKKKTENKQKNLGKRENKVIDLLGRWLRCDEGSLSDEVMESGGIGVEEVVRLREASGNIESEGFSDWPAREMAMRIGMGSERLWREESKSVKAASSMDSDAAAGLAQNGGHWNHFFVQVLLCMCFSNAKILDRDRGRLKTQRLRFCGRVLWSFCSKSLRFCWYNYK